jgi:hypothetical protein
MLQGKASRIAAALVALFALTIASGAHARGWGQSHGRVVVGVGVGVPIFWPYWSYWHYPPPYYYYPHYYPRYGEPAESVIYVERGDAEPTPGEDASQYWYFCRDSNTYFPYVKECPTPWQRVVPQPPPR